MIAALMAGFAHRRFLAACGDPLAAQAAQLRRILWQARHTDIGKASGFDRLAGIADPARLVAAYQEAVPVRTWSGMRSALDAVYRGDWRALCPSAPLYFSMTAGSTGKFKYLPVTREYRREVGRSSLIFYGALQAAFPSLRRKRAQFLVGSAEGGASPAGVPQGFASGFNYRNLPAALRSRFILPYWIFTLDDPMERAYAAGRILTGDRRLGALCAISPVNLIHLREALEAEADRLCEDVARGTLTVKGTAAVPGLFRTVPNPALAALLGDARRAEGRFPTRLLFPALEVLVSWQGGNMSYYLPDLTAAFGIERRFEFPISASEAVFAIPVAPDRAGGVAAITSHFLEFLPEDGQGDALRVDQLAEGAEYRIVVTTSGGLYRYDMEDILRVTGFRERTPVLEFISKTERRVSVSNERITERDVTIAMATACDRCGFRPGAFLFVPCSDRRYRVLLDGVAAGESALPRLADELERQLRAAALGYDFEREDALLDPLELIVTVPGALRRYLDDRMPASLPNAQVKPLHLTTLFDLDRSFTPASRHAAPRPEPAHR
jgi:hypothetical protein